jgi:hypothetical protein
MAISASERIPPGRLIAGAAATLALVLVACTNHPRPAAAPSLAAQRRSADRFMAAWRRSLGGTWAVDATFERRVGTKRLASDVHEAQRPPDRLRTAGGTVEGRIAGRVIGCTTGADGQLSCRDGGPALPYEDDVRRQLDALGTYFVGSHPLYRSELRAGGCFALVLQRGILAPPYGETARFCFDPATGAPTLTEVHKRGSVDVTRAVAVRTPTVADLTPPPLG